MSRRNERTKLKSRSLRRSDCPVSCALDVIGDKWKLLIIRDLFFGKTRYKEFQESGEGIPSNILADRLQQLEAAGLIGKTPYQARPRRYAYQLTETGKSLAPVLKALSEWAAANIPGTKRPAFLKSPE